MTFSSNFGKINKFWSLGLGIYDEVSVSKVMVWTTSLLFSVANAKKHNSKWSVKYFIVRMRFNKISVFKALLKRIKSPELQQFFRSVSRKFLYTQACKITPSDKSRNSKVEARLPQKKVEA